MNRPRKLTPEEHELGLLYAWLHRRAEGLRQQKATEFVTPPGQETDSAVSNTPTRKVKAKKKSSCK